jgi:hypothetical protein
VRATRTEPNEIVLVDVRAAVGRDDAVLGDDGPGEVGAAAVDARVEDRDRDALAAVPERTGRVGVHERVAGDVGARSCSTGEQERGEHDRQDAPALEWGREDSNLRRLSRRVYSPFPLAARAHPRERRL